MKTKITFLFILFSLSIQAQIGIFIPDANFKSALISAGIDTNSDGEIQISEAHAVTGTLDVNTSNISSLTGISYFTNITELIVYGNSIENLHLSSNTNLTLINAAGNNRAARSILIPCATLIP